MSRKLWVYAYVGLFVFCAVPATRAAGYPFTDTFESGTTEWSLNGLWGATTLSSHSPVTALTDSPGRFYVNNTDTAASLATSISLAGATRPILRFYHHYALEDGYDFGRVEISTDGGTSWISPPLAEYTGNLGEWTREQLELAAFTGQPNVRVRFRLVTDTSVVKDGWFVDDVLIGEAPSAPGLGPLASDGPNRITLAWTPAAGDVSTYRVYRARTAAIDWHTARPVAELPAGTTNYADVAVAPKTTYYYQVMALSSNEAHALSTIVSATTPAGMDYPFLDNGEAGGGIWNAESPWALSDEDALSPTRAWTESPGTNYANDVNASLTLVSSMDFSTAVAPTLCFAHKYDIASGDSGNAEVSINGADWTSLKQFAGSSTGAWLHERYDLSAYAGQAAVYLRMRFTSDYTGVADGWHVDDISVAEAPATINAPVITDVASHSMRLTWGVSTNEDFARYEVYRSTETGVDFNDTLVTAITSRAASTCVATGLALDTEYYFRVYQVSAYGTYSAAGTENHDRTLNNPIPFSEDFEGDLIGWNIEGDWATTTNNPYAGGHALTDSPGTTYAINRTTWAQTAVDLSGSTWPVLRFRSRHQLAAGDELRVGVSTDGSNFTWLYGSREGKSPDWRLHEIDLTQWRNAVNLRIRFSLYADNAGTVADGWTIDDVEVVEHTPLTIAYPFSEGFESGLSNWLVAGWSTRTNTPFAGHSTAWAKDEDFLPTYTWLHSSLGGRIDLSGASNPQLVYWLKGLSSSYTSFRWQISTDDGLSWSDLSGTVVGNVTYGDWTRFQASLAGYAPNTVRLRFSAYQDRYYYYAMQMALDGIAIEDQPVNTLLKPPVPHLKSIDLAWDPSTLGTAFQRYEIYRDVNPNVDLTDVKVASFTDINTTNMTDTGLSIGQLYYYRLFVVDTNHVYSSGNEKQATTVPIRLGFSDPMETMDNWDATGAWGPDTLTKHGGAASLGDSPGDNYAYPGDRYILTAVDLSGSTWPVLRFWDRVELGGGDEIRLLVSANGTDWTTVYGAREASRTDWALQEIDLSEWRNASNLRIKFNLNADNAATTAYGWNIDDLDVVDHTPLTITYPFSDGFEDGGSNWLMSSWSMITNSPFAGANAAWAKDPDFLPNYTYLRACLDGRLDLSGATNPQLVYWVKGALSSYTDFRWQVSTDDGLTWGDVPGTPVGNVAYGDWTRFQASLATYAPNTVRLRFAAHQDRYYYYAMHIAVDGIVIEDQPVNSLLRPLVPHLKSIDLSWDPSTLGAAFQRYEIYRDVTPNVDLTDVKVASFTDINTTNVTDTGLSIGQLYYYRLFVVDTNHVYSSGSEKQATTVPIRFGFSDPMETMDNWDATGAWGPDTLTKHGGAASLGDSPGDNYTYPGDRYILTAVDLTGSTWPVLRFWDRVELGGGDEIRLLVSANGTDWTTVYGAREASRTDWALQEIDLSEWRNASNLRIKFNLYADGAATTAYGWNIDDLDVVDHTPPAITYPFSDGFEDGGSNWLMSSWSMITNAPFAGANAAWAKDPDFLPNYTYLRACLDGRLDLSGAANPQLVYWVKGALSSYTDFRWQASTDDGLTWGDVPGTAFGNATYGDWTRFQASLATYAPNTVRLRFAAHQDRYYYYAMHIAVDGIVIEDQPPNAVLNLPIPYLKSIDLSWDPSSLGAAFQRYELRRDVNQNVDLADTLVASFTDVGTTNFTDTGLLTGQRYYYRLFVVNTNHTYSSGSEKDTTTTRLPIGLNDPMDDISNWDITGNWGADTFVKRSGDASLGDSPGDNYGYPGDTYMVTAVDLTGSTWPVLRFWDRVDLNSGDEIRLMVSANGTDWTTVYGGREERHLEWEQQQIDLSEWRNASNLRIKFNLYADNAATTAYGWNIDDLELLEHTPATVGYPFYESFENGTSNWLMSAWTTTTDAAYAGTHAAWAKDPDYLPTHTYLRAQLGGRLSLSNAVSPELVYRIKGAFSSYTDFRWQISSDDGLSWSDLPGTPVGGNVAYDTWTAFRVNLAAYIPQTVRLRFVAHQDRYNYYTMHVAVDGIGIGEPTPGAPSLHSPTMLESVPVLRPTLRVHNATDYQADPLDYEFEVYADAALSNLVASVPAVAQGVNTTAWIVDTDLPDGAQYWWRCRAADAGGAGPWMDTAAFYVNHVNSPPLRIALAGPPAGSILHDASHELVWRPTRDPDTGGRVTAYHVQVDDDPAFSEPTIDDDTITVGDSVPAGAQWTLSMPLSAFAGADGLTDNTTYFWRMRAVDQWDTWSDWSTNALWFVFGTPPPTLRAFVRTAPGTFSANWDRSGTGVIVEFSPSLTAPDWQPVSETVFGTNTTVTLPTDQTAGFFRTRTESTP